jgi:probable addiction module antidote protein
MKPIKIARFDAADYLDSEAAIAAYINAALEEGDADLLMAAIADVAKARRIPKAAPVGGRFNGDARLRSL